MALWAVFILLPEDDTACFMLHASPYPEGVQGYFVRGGQSPDKSTIHDRRWACLCKDKLCGKFISWASSLQQRMQLLLSFLETTIQNIIPHAFVSLPVQSTLGLPSMPILSTVCNPTQ